MKVLFAVNDEKDAEAITRVYQKEYKEIISSKTVYYFNAIIKELQKDKTYDRIVISEDLEMFTSDNYQAVDKFIFEKMDAISDEATNAEGNDIPIILLCMDRRTKNDPLLVKLFGLGLYNVLVGQDRSIQKVASLMYKPRSKKEAKSYYRVEAEDVGYSAADKNGGVSESEIQNILTHYKKIGDNIPKCVQSFDSIASQYSKDQMKLIIQILPNNVKVILEENSDTYRKIMGIKGRKIAGTSQLRKTEYVEKEIESGNRLTQPVIIPTVVNTQKVNKVSNVDEIKKKKIEAKKKEEERIAREKAEAEARRKEQERIAREKAAEEARRKEEERIAREKAEAEARRKEEERIAREKAAEEARRKEEERIAREKAEIELRRKEEEEMAKEKDNLEDVVIPVKRGRGRPRKNPVEAVVLDDVPVKKKRGRPRKNPIIENVEDVEDVVKAEDNKVQENKSKVIETAPKTESNSIDDFFDFDDFEGFDNTVTNVKKDVDSVKEKANEKISQKAEKIDDLIDDDDLLTGFDDIDDNDDDNIDDVEENDNIKSNDIENVEENEDYDDYDFDDEEEESDDYNFDAEKDDSDNYDLDAEEEESDDYDLDDDEYDFDIDEDDSEDSQSLPLDNESDDDFDDAEDDVENNVEDDEFEYDEEDEELNDEENDETLPELSDDDEYDEDYDEDYDDEYDDDEYDEDYDFIDSEDEEESEENQNEEDDHDLLGFSDEETDEDSNEESKEEISETVNESEELPGLEDDEFEYEDDDDISGFDTEEENTEDESLPEFDDYEDDNDEVEDNGNIIDDNDVEDEVEEDETDDEETIQHNGAFRGINNRNYRYDNNLANSIKDLKETEETSSYNVDTDNLITSDQKIISFVGTTKNGTSFIVNNLAEMFSNQGIETAILDLTKNKNSYYVYTNNEDELREKAHDCFEKLRTGIADGIKVNKNLTVFTSLPGEDDSLDDVTNIIKTLLENYTIVLLDCDFETDVRYFRTAQEVYLVQSWDVLTIQPLTAFLRDLKVKNILDTNKLRVIINKNVNVGSISEKSLIGGMSSYSDPAMTYMTELFNRDTIRYITIPFDNQVYIKYLEGLANCKISTNGYPKSFMSSLNKLGDMVYPTVSGKKSKYNDYSGNNNAFSKNTSSILDRMKKKY